jgi:hypothetical protein
MILHHLGPEAVNAMTRVDCWHNNDAPTGVTMLYMTPVEGNEHSFEDPGVSG